LGIGPAESHAFAEESLEAIARNRGPARVRCKLLIVAVACQEFSYVRRFTRRFSPCRRPSLIRAAFSDRGRGHRFRAVFDPFSTVYRKERRPENAVASGFQRIGRQKYR